MWSEFFRDGGWGMYPTTVFGFFLVGAAVLFLLRPERRWGALVVSLGIVTFGSGLLGTSVGFVNTLRYLPQVPSLERGFQIAAIGLAESLNNVVLALIIIVITALLASGAALRAGLAQGSARNPS